MIKVTFINLDDNEVKSEKVLRVDPETNVREEQEDEINRSNLIPKNIFDPSQCKSIDSNLRDLLVEKGQLKLLKITDKDFPKMNFRYNLALFFIFKTWQTEKSLKVDG